MPAGVAAGVADDVVAADVAAGVAVSAVLLMYGLGSVLAGEA